MASPNNPKTAFFKWKWIWLLFPLRNRRNKGNREMHIMTRRALYVVADPLRRSHIFIRRRNGDCRDGNWSSNNFSPGITFPGCILTNHTMVTSSHALLCLWLTGFHATQLDTLDQSIDSRIKDRGGVCDGPIRNRGGCVFSGYWHGHSRIRNFASRVATTLGWPQCSTPQQYMSNAESHYVLSAILLHQHKVLWSCSSGIILWTEPKSNQHQKLRQSDKQTWPYLNSRTYTL
jgi:hypothetical protein